MNDPWQLFAGHGASQRLALLRAIAAEGSISAAARRCGISYKAAWQQVDNMNRQSDSPLVERLTGGRGGGGTRLTELGAQLLHAGDNAGSALQAAAGASPALSDISRLPLRTFYWVSQLGMLTVVLGYGERNSALAGLALLVGHALFKSSLFLVVGVIDRQLSTRDIGELSGVGRQAACHRSAPGSSSQRFSATFRALRNMNVCSMARLIRRCWPAVCVTWRSR